MQLRQMCSAYSTPQPEVVASLNIVHRHELSIAVADKDEIAIFSTCSEKKTPCTALKTNLGTCRLLLMTPVKVSLPRLSLDLNAVMLGEPSRTSNAKHLMHGRWTDIGPEQLQYKNHAPEALACGSGPAWELKKMTRGGKERKGARPRETGTMRAGNTVIEDEGAVAEVPINTPQHASEAREDDGETHGVITCAERWTVQPRKVTATRNREARRAKSGAGKTRPVITVHGPPMRARYRHDDEGPLLRASQDLASVAQWRVSCLETA
ncbi:hypothetical protein C8R44DRAFT_753496 [Mycena epipterygia]|nr:hypothetical protein C8R44DRAFT_753496 [Mycena epipterygia]